MSRRANNEGSIFRRQDGRWAASISLGNGKRKHFLGRTRADVSQKLVTALKAQQEGMPVWFERQTFSRFSKQWLESVQPSLKPRTWQRYEQLLRCHIEPVIGKTTLENLTPQQLQALYTRLLAGGLAPATVHQVHAVIHRALRQAVLWHLVPRNVAGAVTPPRPRRFDVRTLSPEEARRLVAAAEGRRFGPLVVVALTTGMRQGELFALKWSDIDLDRGALQVRSSLQRTRDGFVFTEPKTARSRRQVRLTQSAVAVLRKHRAGQAVERLLVGAAWQDMELVFPNQTGGPLEASHVLRRGFYPLLEVAGLPKLRFHDLRHTAATLLLGQGTHPKIVSEMLGHSTIAITMDLYSHVTPTMQEQAVQAMEGILA